MGTRYVVQRDTGSWRTQVWSAFVAALGACLGGMAYLPGQDLDRAFLALGVLFSLFASFAVSKTQRDNRDGQVDTPSWIAMVWIAFAGALTLTAWGIWRMQMDGWIKSYLLVSWLFLLSSCFTLAKMLRDRHEAELLEQSRARGEEA